MSAAVGHVPPVFVSHGAPSLATDPVRGAELAAWASRLPRPRAILVLSAHWHATVLTRGSTATRPKLHHVFGDDGVTGVPRDIGRVAYPAPGAPDLAYELHGLLPIERAGNQRWDPGVWMPLVHMFPAADIPVLQLSLVQGATPRTLFGIGRKIGVLAARGVLLVGSGGITRGAEVDPRLDAEPRDWAREFDAWVANALADAEMDELLHWRTKGPNARLAHPTPEHLDPLFVIAGAASLYEHAVGFPIRGFEHATLSRRCIQFGR